LPFEERRRGHRRATGSLGIRREITKPLTQISLMKIPPNKTARHLR
jgi:hypothetical protein